MKGRPVDPKRARRGTGHTPVAGHKKALVKAPPIAAQLAESVPPADLPASVVDVWQACVVEMAGNRHLRAPDLVLLRAYCEAVAVHAEASAEIHAMGVLVDSPMGPQTNPMVKVQKDAAATMRQLSEVLGLNPLARIRAGIMELAVQSLALGIRDRLVDQLTKEK